MRNQKMTRRQLLMLAGETGALVLLGSLLPRRAEALVRPPGALTERQFLAHCIRCDRCVQVCPTRAIQVAGIAEGLPNVGTPVVRGYCNQCLACARVCPTGALMEVGPSEVDIGDAVLDAERCLAHQGTRCLICYELCPVQAVAVTEESTGVPKTRVDVEKCIGCGVCEMGCPVNPPAIVVEPSGAKRVGG